MNIKITGFLTPNHTFLMLPLQRTKYIYIEHVILIFQMIRGYYSFGADWWAVGVIAYQMATGSVSFWL